jgi:hypothetical protein
MTTISYSCGLTVLDAASGARADVLVSLDGPATVRDVAHAIADALAPGDPSARHAGVDGAGTRGARAAGERTGDERLAIVIRHPRFTQEAEASLRAFGPSVAGWHPSTGERGTATLWVDGGPLAAELPAARVLRDGMVVSLSPRYAPATSLAEPGGVAEVRVAGGPAAGSVHRLGLGRFEIGADPRCAVAVSVGPQRGQCRAGARCTPGAGRRAARWAGGLALRWGPRGGRQPSGPAPAGGGRRLAGPQRRRRAGLQPAAAAAAAAPLPPPGGAERAGQERWSAAGACSPWCCRRCSASAWR